MGIDTAQRELILCTLCGAEWVTVHVRGAWHEPWFGNQKHPSARNSPKGVMGQWKCQLGLSAQSWTGIVLSS